METCPLTCGPSKEQPNLLLLLGCSSSQDKRTKLLSEWNNFSCQKGSSPAHLPPDRLGCAMSVKKTKKPWAVILEFSSSETVSVPPCGFAVLGFQGFVGIFTTVVLPGQPSAATKQKLDPATERATERLPLES